ncbi:cysteine-rich receptor-like protein kinase 44 [Euphorbia lathyris]|uniref:cysteine-rich receptor-like protein kinase 44 n=1 Tax=Euphorbia lathyris TaxID=212925 RepID=UPI00331422F9
MDYIISISLIFSILMLIRFGNGQIRVGQTIVSCNYTSNFTISSNYSRNRNLLLSSLPSKVSQNTSVANFFYSTSIGQGSDKVYGKAICQADSTPQLCSDFLTDSIENLRTYCPNQKEGISVSHFGIHYSNRPVNGVVVLEPTNAGYNVDDLNSENQVEFYEIWNSLMEKVAEKASMGDMVKYATGKVNSTSNQTIYVLMQCFTDLSPSSCRYCLREAVIYYEGCCHGKVGGYAQKPSCWFRWDLYPFANFTGFATAPSPSPLPPPTPIPITIIKEKGGIASKTVVIIVAAVVSFMVVMNLLYILYHRKKTSNSQHIKDSHEDNDEISTIESLQFDIKTLQIATNNFSIHNKLGEGGFGAVFKGILPDGRTIAVKRWSKDSSQGKVEFENEVLLLAKLQHRNLVRLFGYCFQEKERLLVYEFIQNTSLDCYIFDSHKRLILDWNKRYKIIEGIAKGILYLHQDSRIQVIHRDLKPSNVLLDDQMNPKISDFGTARLFEVDQSQIATHRIVGTYGYMSPEYAMHGQISIKSDVFSFGVLVLEILSGQKVSRFGYGEVNEENLLTYTWKNWNEGTPLNVIDKISLSNGSTQEMIRCIHIGLLCVQEDLGKRPTMSSIVLMLSSSSVSLPVPSIPAYFMSNIDEFEAQQSFNHHLFTTDESVNQMSLTDQGPR